MSVELFKTECFFRFSETQIAINQFFTHFFDEHLLTMKWGLTYERDKAMKLTDLPQCFRIIETFHAIDEKHWDLMLHPWGNDLNAQHH